MGLLEYYFSCADFGSKKLVPKVFVTCCVYNLLSTLTISDNNGNVFIDVFIVSTSGSISTSNKFCNKSCGSVIQLYYY